jgi:hypothetical protein
MKLPKIEVAKPKKIKVAVKKGPTTSADRTNRLEY